MLKQVQAVTGLIFAVFVVVHLMNTWLAGISAERYDAAQQALRQLYQFAPVEALLLSALAVHIVVGLMRWRSDPGRGTSLRARWHRYAGVFLLIVIGGHIFAVRGPSWFADIYPGFAGLAFSLDYVPGYFYPYYFLLGLAGFYHMANGTGIALARLGVRAHLSGRILWSGTALAAGLGMLSLLGMGGVLYDVGDPTDSEFGQLALRIVHEYFP